MFDRFRKILCKGGSVLLKKWIKLLCLSLALITLVNGLPFSVRASEEDVAQESIQESLENSGSQEETVPEETLPAETVPAETVPEQTQTQETAPEQTQTQETAPAETESEQGQETETQTEVKDTKGIPNYYQNDYPDVRFGYGTVASSGCSVTCLAMVATYLTGHSYSPAELAGYVGWRGQNNMERLEQGSELLQLPYTKNTNWHVTEQALREGKVAIVLMNAKSPFTDSQHFVLITGISEDGRYYVHDPNRDNYGKWDLRDGFANGFQSYAITAGFSGAWVYDKSEMPQTPFIYWEDSSDIEPRYSGLKLTLAEEELLAKVVWVEARGESFEGQQAVAEVALNRLASGDFPDSLRDVIFGEGQFRSVPFLDKAEPNHTQYEAIRRALNGPYVLPMDVFYFATYPVNDNVWGTIGGHIFCYQY